MKRFLKKKSDLVKARKLYISPYTVLFLIVAAVFDSFAPAMIAYAVAFLHEFSHFAMAKMLGIKVDSLQIMPFGLSIKLKNNYIKDPQKEFWICFAGPLVNLALFLAALVICYTHNIANKHMDFFLNANVFMCLLNIMPILPLDGGRMLKCFLTDEWGVVKAFNFTHKVGKFFLCFFFVVMCYTLYLGEFGVSLFIMFGFLLFSIFSERKKNNLFLMREIAYSSDKMGDRRIMKIKNIAASPDVSAMRLIEKFSYNTFTIVDIIDKNSRKKSSLTEIQVIEGTINLGTRARISDIFNFYY